MSRRRNYGMRNNDPNEPSYVGEPDWQNVQRTEQATYQDGPVTSSLDPKTLNEIQGDYFRKRSEQQTGFKSQTEDERIAAANNAAEMQRVTAKAQFDAANFELQYTAKDKVEITRIRRGQAEAHRSGLFDEKELAAVDRLADLTVMGIKPTDLPKTTPYEKGKGIGDIWNEDNLGIVTRSDTGKPDVLQGWNKSAPGMAAQHANELEKVKIKARGSYIEKQVEVPAVIDPVNKDVNGNPIIIAPASKRMRTAQEIADFQDLMDGKEPASAARARINKQRTDAGLSPVAEDPYQRADANYQRADANYQRADLQTPNRKGKQQSNNFHNSPEYIQTQPGGIYKGPDGKWRRKQ